MSYLYIVEQGSTLRMEKDNFCVDCRNGTKRIIPSELLESITIFGNVKITTECQKRCLSKGIRVTFLSTHGHYFGRLESTSHVNALRLKKQVYLSDDPNKRLVFAKSTLKAKIHNQAVLLRRYARNSNIDISGKIKSVEYYEKKMDQARNIKEAMGFEGIAARNYFYVLSLLVRPEFKFKGRNRQPPRDPFNALLSVSYTILFYEIFAEVEARGITPYIGFVHQIKNNHPALVSDLLEEWRAVIADATVMSIIQGNEISLDEFTKENDGVVISENGIRILTRKLEKKMRTDMNYLSKLEAPMSFRRGIWWQVKSLAHCIDDEDLSSYKPLRIR